MKNKRSALCRLNVIFYALVSKFLFSSLVSVLFQSLLVMLLLCQNSLTSMAQPPTSTSALSTKDTSVIISPHHAMTPFKFQSSVTETKSFDALSSEVPIQNVIVDAGSDVRLNCTGKQAISSHSSITWVRHHSNETTKGSIPPPFQSDENGSILIPNIDHISDNATYTCIVDNRKVNVLRLKVKSTPSAVINLSVIPHSVYALVRWTMPKGRDGGHPILRYELLYRLNYTNPLLVNNISSNTANNSQTDHMQENDSIQLLNDWNPSPPSKEEYKWRCKSISETIVQG